MIGPSSELQPRLCLSNFTTSTPTTDIMAISTITTPHQRHHSDPRHTTTATRDLHRVTPRPAAVSGH